MDESSSTTVPARAGSSRRRTAERWDDAAALILAIAAVLAAWAGYQAARWGGIRTEHITASTTFRAQSSLAAATTVLDVQVDMTAFVAWTQAVSTGDLEEAAFHQDRFRPELRHAFATWLGDVVPTDVTQLPPGLPMATEAYDLEAQRAVEDLVRQADDELERAFEADRVADANVLVTVVLSMALFLVGIASRFREPRLKAGLTILASLVLGFGVAIMATLPQHLRL